MHENLWIITPGALSLLERAEALALSGAPPLAAASARTQSRTTNTADKVARVPVVGVLTPTPDRLAGWLGVPNTTYAQIADALTQAAEDPLVRAIELEVDSPGGAVTGLFEVVEVIEAIRAGGKPLSVVARSAQSAAYILAAAAGPITASSAAAPFGSVGVAVAMHTHPQVSVLTNTASPAKRPDPTTPEGRGIVREHLDAIHAMATRAIAKGRGRSESGITEAFGAGRTYLAEQALGRGMIDAIERQTVTVRTSIAVQAEKLVARLEGRAVPSGEGAVPFAGCDMQDRIAKRLYGSRFGEAAPPAPAPYAPQADGDMQDRIAERLYTSRAEHRENGANLRIGADQDQAYRDMQDELAGRLAPPRGAA